MRMGRNPLVIGLLALPCIAACREGAAAPRAGTREMRAALADTLIARSARRDAFSPLKNAQLGFDPVAAMRAARADVIAAETETDLFYALARLSHARRDRHLDVALVPGGIQLLDSAGLEIRGAAVAAPRRAPVRFFPDYSADSAGYFVGDVAADERWRDLPAIGSRVVSVNGTPAETWAAQAAAYTRHSTRIGLRWHMAQSMGLATAAVPSALRGERLQLEVEDANGARSMFTLPYVEEATLAWSGTGEPAYPGLAQRLQTPTYDLLVPEDGRRFLVLLWRGFRETMVADVDTLMAYADRQGLLDHAVILDVTRSRGGSLGPYAMQRLQPRPFRTTFGNLRISDVTGPFIAGKRDEFAARSINDGGVAETIDDGSWLMAWLETDVAAALARGDAYTNAVPFKLAHASRDSDGVLSPAPLHFRGPFGIICGPQGGSHLDQFVAITVDNGLGPVVGMPPGGYSNTWEWDEVVTFPGTDQPVIAFMWNIGHTLRPNGEILEGNPARVDEWIPLTRDNVRGYHALMLERLLARLGR